MKPVFMNNGGTKVKTTKDSTKSADADKAENAETTSSK